MFVLLPPSETKATGGVGAPLDLTSLRFPGLLEARQQMVSAVTDLCLDLPAARAALAVSPTKDSEIVATAGLRSAATMPAMLRYTGVLYEALDIPHLPPAARTRAGERLLIQSALFGLIAGRDAVPAYRLSAGSALPGIGGIPAFWRPRLAVPMASLDRPLVDLRSGAYGAFAPLPDAITVRVVTENAAGQRTVVSHFNKATKGLLARALVTSRAEIDTVVAVARVTVVQVCGSSEPATGRSR